MKTLAYGKIDAFTSGNSLGNPAAVLFLEAGQTLEPAEMLDIARQHKGFVSEVVYCSPCLPAGSSGSGFSSEYALTYYSSECEVDFCGHGTIACMYALLRETAELRGRKEIVIRTRKKGALTVYNELAAHDAVFVAAPEARHIGSGIAAEEIAEKLSLTPGRIDPSRPADIIDAGLRTLIVPLRSLHDEIHVFPDERILKGFCVENSIDIVLVYSVETAAPGNIAHTRVFAPRFGYLEDPATGSGNSAFGHYLRKNGMWDGGPATVEQGGADREFNSVRLAFREGRVLFGGRATTRIRGTYFL